MIAADPQSKDKLDRLGVKAVYALDDYLGLSNLPFKMTLGAMLCCCYWAQNQGCYQNAEMVLREHTHIRINDDTIRHVTNIIGGIVHEKLMADAERRFEDLKAGRLVVPDETRKGVLYLMCDGATINTRLKDEDGSSWRENKLGVVFSSDDITTHTSAKGKKVRKLNNRMYCAYLGSVDEFRKLLFSTAYDYGYMQYDETVFISDGARWIANMVEEDYPDAVHILDFFHLKENVYSYAKARFNHDEDRYRQWAEDINTLLHDGKADEVLEKLDPDEKYPNTVNLYDYIEFHRDHVNYPEYEAKGYYIGSGAVESANKTVLQSRMKRSGMRWEPKYAQAMITLRAMEESGRWLDVINIVRDHYGYQKRLF